MEVKVKKGKAKLDQIGSGQTTKNPEELRIWCHAICRLRRVSKGIKHHHETHRTEIKDLLKLSV